MNKEERAKKPRTPSAPKEIEQFIELVNLLPFWFPRGMEFSTYQSKDTHPALFNKLEEFSDNAQRLAAEGKLEPHLPEEDLENIEQRVEKFKQYILGNLKLKPTFELQKGDSEFDLDLYENLLEEAIWRYENFCSISGALRLIAWAKFRGVDDWYAEKIPFTSREYFSINKEGKLQLKTDENLHLFIGIEVDRIKQCKLCDRIFWAKRLTMTACPDKCGNILNNRKYYYQNREIVKQRNLMRKRADEELKKMGFTENHIKIYKKQKGFLPRTLIYKYLLKESLETQVSAYDIYVPERIKQPLKDFILRF